MAWSLAYPIQDTDWFRTFEGVLDTLEPFFDPSLPPLPETELLGMLCYFVGLGLMVLSNVKAACSCAGKQVILLLGGLLVFGLLRGGDDYLLVSLGAVTMSFIVKALTGTIFGCYLSRSALPKILFIAYSSAMLPLLVLSRAIFPAVDQQVRLTVKLSLLCLSFITTYEAVATYAPRHPNRRMCVGLTVVAMAALMFPSSDILLEVTFPASAFLGFIGCTCFKKPLDEMLGDANAVTGRRIS